MKSRELEEHISRLEDLLKDFQEAKTKGKNTNENEERAQAIAEIEGITRRLEEYMQSNDELLSVISGSNVDPSTEIEWNNIVRPAHFEEDLKGVIDRLKKERTE